MNNRRAFTLIELLVVIAIIGILATIATVGLSGVRARARDTQRVAGIKQAQTALEMFYNDNNRYPTEDEWNSGTLVSSTVIGTTTYMAHVPVAPRVVDGTCDSDSNTFYYTSLKDGASYLISYCLGGSVASISAGLNCASPEGINIGQNCGQNLQPGYNCTADTRSATCDPNNPVPFETDSQNGKKIIRDCCQLQNVANDLSDNFELGNNINCANAVNWSGGYQPINGFGGTFDGQDCNIENLSINSSGNSTGIFGSGDAGAYNVSFSNLNIINANIVGVGGVGALIGNIVTNNQTVITNCHLYNSAVGGSGSNIGGLTGFFHGTISSSTAKNVDIESQGGSVGGIVGTTFDYGDDINNCNLIGTNNVTGTGYAIGGIIGFSHGAISNSSVNNLTLSGLHTVGGIAGTTYDTVNLITNCHLTGTNHITVDKEYDTSIAGGIVGWAQGAISNSTVNNLTINGTGHYIGGIAGITFDNTETVSDCHLTGINNLIGSNSNFIGGLVGFAHGAISNSTVNNLTISGGGESVGGIAGTTFDDPQTVTNCHLTGTNHISSSGDNVGGLVGFAHGAISNSTISNLTLDVNGSSVGGIAGGTFDSSNIVDNCHLTGVNSINITNGSWAGGLVGSVHALISNSSLSNTTINASDEYNSIGGIGGEMVGSDGNYISNSYFSGSISSAGENIGGLTGILDYNQIINNSYAIASVNSGTEHHCLVGKDMGGTTVNYSYYRDTCNLGGLGTALSDINMKDSLNYDSSWNINNPSCNDASATYPWRLKSGNYPCLYNESSCACN